MPFWYSLEKKFGRFAIPGLIRYLVAFTAASYVLSLASGPKSLLLLNSLALDGPSILRGEIWRVVTWPMLPPTITFFGIHLSIFVQVILMVFVLQCLWTFGDLVESAWGAFRLNAFFFTGMLGSIAAALLFQIGGVFFTANLTLSILFAVAMVAPDFQLLLYMILPVKVKWLAWIALALLLLQWIAMPWTLKIATLFSFANCIVFLGPELIRRTRQSRDIAARRAKFQSASHSAETLHRCEACGRTEVSNPDLDFRVTASGNEYCTDHLPPRAGN